MGICGSNTLDEGLAFAKVLLRIGKKIRTIGEERQAWRTFVMSEVAVSISCSSRDRSEKPGRTCFAWSLSRAVTGDTITRYAARLARMSEEAINILLAWVPASISSTWSAMSTLSAPAID